MARLPRKLTTALLGHHQIAWLRDLADQEGDGDLVRACDIARSARGPGVSLKDIRSAQKIVVAEINRRMGHPLAGSGRGMPLSSPLPGAGGHSPGSARVREGAKKSTQQLEAEIRELLGDGRDGREVSVVVAWTEDTQEIAPGQRAWRHDLGERPKFVDVKKPHAVMWTNRGMGADVAKARLYVQKEHPVSGQVFVYPVSERDPLGRARRDALSTVSR